jgi:MFS family permease
MPEAQKIFSGSEAYHEALLREPPKTWSSASILLYACSLVGFLCSTMNGYDGSLSNSLLENENFVSLYHGSDSGSWASWTTYVYVVGGIVSLPFVGPSSDTWGRRWGMFIGACIVILGTVLMTTSSYDGSYGQFMGGRFALGFGVNIASAAGPMYVVEISHPAHRGVMTAFYNTWWFIGNILAAGSARGCNNLAGHISWVIPLWLQLFFPAVILIFFVFLPESPRWLYVNGQQAKAKAMLTKYHGEGNPNSAWVNLQLFEYNEFLDMDGADKRWWDYRALFRTRENLYRLFCNVTVAVFGQWAGNCKQIYFMVSSEHALLTLTQRLCRTFSRLPLKASA